MGNTIIYMVRHTDVHNPGDILYGRLPRFGLGELGWKQAEVTASVLAETAVGAFYSSLSYLRFFTFHVSRFTPSSC